MLFQPDWLTNRVSALLASRSQIGSALSSSAPACGRTPRAFSCCTALPPRAKLLRYGVPIPTAAENNWLRFLNALNDYSRTEQLEIGREEGLKEVAKLTGGKAVTNTNDLSSVFNDVLEDASGYYVIGFYPADARQLGRFRPLKVSMDIPGVKVYSPEGYYEPLPFTEMSKREGYPSVARTPVGHASRSARSHQHQHFSRRR